MITLTGDERAVVRKLKRGATITHIIGRAYYILNDHGSTTILDVHFSRLERAGVVKEVEAPQGTRTWVSSSI